VAAVQKHGVPVDRREAEAQPGYVQPIPLAYLQFRDRVLLVPRSGRNGPHGLNATHAIWVGGHVRDTDGDGMAAVRRGLLREIEEEIQLRPRSEPDLVGMVLDQQGDLPRMHVGIVHRIMLDGMDAESLPGELVAIAGLDRRSGYLEPWSRSIIAEHLQHSAPSPSV
jgi:predicted NUDIX family phosphoesterase